MRRPCSNSGIVCSLSLIHTQAWTRDPCDPARRRWEALVMIYSICEKGTFDAGGLKL